MSEKFDAAAPRGCGRGEELVAYLYGEASEEEAGLFRRHLEACAVCREELAAFGDVREAVGTWRAEVLGAVPSLNIEEALAAPAIQPAPRKRSARAALREFFSLSPTWLRAGAFAAALVACALLSLTLARAEVRWDSNGLAFRAGASEKVLKERVEVPVRSGYTDEQVNAIVAQKVEEARAQAIAETEKRIRQPPPQEQVIAAADRRPADDPAPRRKRSTRSGSRRDQPLIAEDDLPRLSDLLGGSY